MTKITPTLESFVQVPEDTIRKAWEKVSFDEASGFALVIRAADEYKAAGMTPLFILNQESMKIYVIAEETFGKRLH